VENWLGRLGLENEVGVVGHLTHSSDEGEATTEKAGQQIGEKEERRPWHMFE
jgi:hypothetical protein